MTQQDSAVAPIHVSNSGRQFAFSRRISPEFCSIVSPLLKQGRREGRAPAGTRNPCAMETHTGWTTGFAGSPGLPCAMVLTVSFVLSPGSDALLPPSPCGWLTCVPGRAAHITARLDAQTPGVRTTRLLRPRTSSHASSRAGVCSPSRPCEDAVSAVSSARRQLLTAKAALQCHSRPTPSRPSHPSPRFVTIAIRPLSRARMFACTINPNFGKVEYLRCRGFDRS